MNYTSKLLVGTALSLSCFGTTLILVGCESETKPNVEKSITDKTNAYQKEMARRVVTPQETVSVKQINNKENKKVHSGIVQIDTVKTELVTVEQDPTLTYAELSQKALKHFNEKDFDKSEANYQKMIELRDTSAGPRVQLARIYIKKNQLANARLEAQRATEIAPSWSTAWNTFGRVELIEGNYDQAEDHFVKATDLNEDNFHAWNNLGLTRIKKKEYKSATQALEVACADPRAKSFMFNNLGIAYERLTQKDDALDAFKSGLALGSELAGKNFARLSGITAKSIEDEAIEQVETEIDTSIDNSPILSETESATPTTAENSSAVSAS